jgi:hypothetical protein
MANSSTDRKAGISGLDYSENVSKGITQLLWASNDYHAVPIDLRSTAFDGILTGHRGGTIHVFNLLSKPRAFMLNRLRHRVLHRLQLRESWFIFFIMGIIMMNFPFLNIFNKSVDLFGFPLLFLYLFIGWAVSIFVIYLFVVATGVHDTGHQDKKEP